MPRFLWCREGHVSLAWELLVAKRIRPLIAIAGVAVSVVLIVVVIALYRGWQDTGSALVRLPGEVWVVQLGSSNLFDSVSQIDGDVVQGVGDRPGGARAVPCGPSIRSCRFPIW